MRAFKLIIAFAIVACVVAEPPRRASLPRGLQLPQPKRQRPFKNQGSRIAFPARQTEETDNGNGDDSSNGYHYPKPTDAYGPPEKPTDAYGPPEKPTDEYGPPATEAAPPSDSELDNLRKLFAQQLKKLKSLTKPQPIKVQKVKHTEPIVYLEYPESHYYDWDYFNHHDDHHHHF